MLDYLMASTPLCAVTMDREQAHSQLGPTSGLPFVPGFGPQLKANADMEKVRPRFSRRF